MQDEFLTLGWGLELQAPQGCPAYLVAYTTRLTFTHASVTINTYLLPFIGPYTNVLDLSLFSSMSHRHSAQLQLYNNTEVSIETIWETVETVWYGMRLHHLKWSVPSFLPTESWRSSSQRTVTILSSTWHPTLQRPQGLSRYFQRNHH